MAARDWIYWLAAIFLFVVTVVVPSEILVGRLGFYQLVSLLMNFQANPTGMGASPTPLINFGILVAAVIVLIINPHSKSIGTKIARWLFNVLLILCSLTIAWVLYSEFVVLPRLVASYRPSEFAGISANNAILYFQASLFLFFAIIGSLLTTCVIYRYRN